MQQARQQLTPQDPRSAINQVPPIQQAEPVAAAKPKSGSLLNKNFFLGAITGLVVGAFVLPTLLGMFFGDSSADVRAQAPTQAQSPVREIASFDPNAPALEEGATFLDEALAADAP